MNGQKDSNERNSFVFYRSYLNCINELPDDYKLKVALAIMNYGLNSTIADDDPIVKSILASIIPMINNSNQRYEIAKANGMKGKEFGVLGGRPKKSDIEQIPILRAKGYTPQKIAETLNIPIKAVIKHFNTLQELEERREKNDL